MLRLFLTILLTISFISVYAQKTEDKPKTDDWKFKAEFQMRSELDGRDFSNKTYAPIFSTLRTRVGLEKTLFDDVSFYMQVQDARVLGKIGYSANGANIDLHQGYALVKNIFNMPISAQAGRFEMMYNNGRIFSPSHWGLVGKSYDGIKFNYKDDMINLDVFDIITNIGQDNIATPAPATYSYPSKAETSFNIYGFWLALNLNKENKLDIYTLYDINRKMTNNIDPDLQRYTFGVNYKLNVNDFTAFFEGNFQTGKSAGKDLSAYQVALNLNYNLADGWYVGLVGDMFTGQDPKDASKVTAFNMDYGTKHILYGLMEYMDNDANIGKLGVIDPHLKFGYNNKKSPIQLEVELHNFMTQQKSLTDKSALGQEIDFVLKYNIVKGATCEWGNGFFLPGELMKDFYQVGTGTNAIKREDIGFWSYLMLRVNI